LGGQEESEEDEDIGNEEEEESCNGNQKQKAYKRRRAPKKSDVNRRRTKITKRNANNTPRHAQNTDPTYYQSFPNSRRSNIRATEVNAGLVNTDVICYSNAIFQEGIASCIHLADFLRSPPNEEHLWNFRLPYKY
jgi:hypothetical protein